MLGSKDFNRLMEEAVDFYKLLLRRLLRDAVKDGYFAGTKPLGEMQLTARRWVQMAREDPDALLKELNDGSSTT